MASNMDKENAHVAECYLAIKKNGRTSFAGKWMELGFTMLNKINPTWTHFAYFTIV
jgi:hypothetical protein